MKTKLFLQTILLFFAITVHAQITTKPAGFAIQGIARDAINKARTNAKLKLTFYIYYTPPTGSTADPKIYETTQDLTTDPYGVFSTVIEPGANNSTLIANKNASLKISEGDVVISNEPLQQVPYAIAASNGSPTGSIMPYVGTLAPEGWVMCDGRTLLRIPGSEDLIELVGNNAPDLRGMFLRGSGTNSSSAYAANVGPALKAIQGDDVKPHTHPQTSSAGAHNHTSKYPNARHGVNATHDDKFINFYSAGAIPEDNNRIPPTPAMVDSATSSAGDHTHTVNENTGTETRPVNYGVNYIIKL